MDESPRAATTHPATLEMLADLGVVDDVIGRGLVARTFQFWDRPSGRLIAEFDHAVLKDDTRYPFVVQCEQHKLVKLVMERLQAFPNVERHVSARVSAVELRDDGVALDGPDRGRDSPGDRALSHRRRWRQVHGPQSARHRFCGLIRFPNASSC